MKGFCKEVENIRSRSSSKGKKLFIEKSSKPPKTKKRLVKGMYRNMTKCLLQIKFDHEQIMSRVDEVRDGSLKHVIGN